MSEITVRHSLTFCCCLFTKGIINVFENSRGQIDILQNMGAKVIFLYTLGAQ